MSKLKRLSEKSHLKYNRKSRSIIKFEVPKESSNDLSKNEIIRKKANLVSENKAMLSSNTEWKGGNRFRLNRIQGIKNKVHKSFYYPSRGQHENSNVNAQLKSLSNVRKKEINKRLLSPIVFQKALRRIKGINRKTEPYKLNSKSNLSNLIKKLEKIRYKERKNKLGKIIEKCKKKKTR